MFVTKSQFFVFMACVTFGGIIGVVFSISALVKFFIKNNLLKAVPDVIAFLPLGLLFLQYSHYLSFPNLRIYMILGVFVGLTFYLKSFHRLLAKIAKKFYNIIVKKYQKRNKNKHDGRKVKKVNRVDDRGGSASAYNTTVYNGLSTDIDKSSKRKRRLFGAKNRRVRTTH